MTYSTSKNALKSALLSHKEIQANDYDTIEFANVVKEVHTF